MYYWAHNIGSKTSKLQLTVVALLRNQYLMFVITDLHVMALIDNQHEITIILDSNLHNIITMKKFFGQWKQGFPG